MAAHRHLVVYAFGPDARFEGQLVGAFERTEAEGGVRVVDALFVMDDPEAGEVAAVDLRGRGDETVARLLTFRLDAQARRRATKRLLAGAGSVPPETVRALSGSLDAGGAILALVVEPGERGQLEEAVQRTGGREVGSEPVDAAALGEVAEVLMRLVEGR